MFPPTSLAQGDFAYSFGSYNYLTQTETLETIPAIVPQAGARFAIGSALPVFASGRSVTWEVEFDAAPNAYAASLQGAMRDVDSEYFDIDTNVSLTALQRTVANVQQKFLRVKLESITAGGAANVAAKILA